LGREVRAVLVHKRGRAGPRFFCCAARGWGILTGQNKSVTKAAMTVNLADIKAAERAIKGAVERTPCHHSKTLSKLTGAEIYLKFDNLQFTASF
jgi:hypothetical protein